ncbi:MAG: PQQ-dependent sugar dehydrogenase, partial [Phycisphaerales bacterium]
MRNSVLAIAATLALAGSVHAGVVLEPYLSGLSSPLGFVQDPSDDQVQYILQQDGVIRVVENGVLLQTPFVDLSGPVGASTGETGLLGLAFPPDYATSGVCYVSYTDANDDSVIARLSRSATDPLQADLGTLTPILQQFQPADNHNGGHIEFGPDGMLYIAFGDGGGSGDIDGNAQNRANLLGCILRIDVSDTGLAGYTVPTNNPFVGDAGVQPEIWSYGLRNPWRFTFDTGVCGTGAMLIADVGQGAREEVNYEPAGEDGRNYGWNCKEGFLDFLGCAPPAGESFTDPILDYPHTIGQSITGGYVYRGARMSQYKGRYFYADFITGRIWSVDVTGGVASDNQEHLDTSIFISSFGRDAAGELYILDYFGGQVLRLTQTEAQENLNTDPIIDGADLGILLGNWGQPCAVGDNNNDGTVDGA